MGSFDLERQLQDLMRRVHLLEVGNPLGYSSVSEGSLRILSNEGFSVEGSAKVSGWLVVTGTERIVGLLEGSGTLDWTGPWYLKGAGTISGNTSLTGTVAIQGDCTVTGKMFVNGPWEMNGAGKIKGNVDVTGELDVTGKTRLRGDTTLENDLEILAGGKIKAGGMIIDTANNGSVTFANGATVHAGSDSVSILYNNRSVTVDGAGIRLGALSVDGGGVNINLGSIGTVTGTGLPAGVLMIDTATGYIKRVYN